MTIYWLYILECKDEYLYTGITANLSKRLLEHNKGKVAFTKNKKPIRLVYKEKFLTRKNAAQREKEIKGWRREKKKNFINSLR